MFRFKADIVVECVPYRAGDVVPAGELPAGSLDSLIRLRLVESYIPPAVPTPEPATVDPEPPAVVVEAPVPKPAAKKGKKSDPAAPSPDGQPPQ